MKGKEHCESEYKIHDQILALCDMQMRGKKEESGVTDQS